MGTTPVIVAVVAALVGVLAAVTATLVSRRRRLSTAAVNAIILRRLHLALDAADAGAWEWRLGLPSLRASGFARLLDLPSDDLVTVSAWEQAVHPDDRGHWQASFRSAIDGGQPWTCLHRVVDDRGGVRWLDVRAEPIREPDGRIDGMLGICVDVTERHERQQRDRRAAHTAQAVSETGAALTALADETLIWAEAEEAAARIFQCDAVRVLPADTALRPAWTDPASGILQCDEPPISPLGGASLIVPVDLAGEREALLALDWSTAQPAPDRALIASLDRFAANIALALVIARRQGASRDRDVLARRLQTGLMPTAGVGDGPLVVEMVYQPGEDRLMLGGDFLDVVTTEDGRVHFIIGDVCGHGPAEAALGTILRSAWTGIVSTSGEDPAAWLAVLEGILVARREQAHTFVTAVAGTVDPASGSVHYAVAGHPPPLLVQPPGAEDRGDTQAVRILDAESGPAMGLGASRRAGTGRAELPSGSALVAFTDGLYEGLGGSGARLGYEAFVAHVARFPLPHGDQALRRLVSSMTLMNGGPLDDDAAALLIAHR